MVELLVLPLFLELLSTDSLLSVEELKQNEILPKEKEPLYMTGSAMDGQEPYLSIFFEGYHFNERYTQKQGLCVLIHTLRCLEQRIDNCEYPTQKTRENTLLYKNTSHCHNMRCLVVVVLAPPTVFPLADRRPGEICLCLMFSFLSCICFRPGCTASTT